MMEWISVEDRLPLDPTNKLEVDNYETAEVICCTQDGWVFANEFKAGNATEPWTEWDYREGEVTHWMPLPEPPEQP